MSKIIVLMGAPGAGKGTQARLLQERLHLPQISTGDILRARAQQNDELAKEIQEVQAAGKLASDDLVGRVVDLERRHARLDQIAKLEQYLSHELPRGPHFSDLFLRFTNNH